MALQASFNQRGMQRGGWWFALSPWLGRMDPAERRKWFARERAVFNTNPYLAPVLLGARCRIEEDHGADLADRVEDTMQRTLGSLGDALTWRAARPICFLGTALAGIAFGPRAVLVAWLMFATAVWLLHRRGQAWGYGLGLDVVDRLGDARLHALAHAGRRVAGVLAGVVSVGAAALTLGAGGEGLALVASLLAIGIGFVLTRLRRGAEWVLLLVMGALILFARWSGEFPEAVITWR
jgi:mannose/fructose/N-acetylgalactosamine-specific phosphotransferase system component IID